MNKKGFTLVELLAVVVLIAIISALTFPNIKKLIDSNSEKEFTSYEKLMITYAKSFPLIRYQDKGYICLKELKMKKIMDSMNCSGFVVISNNNFVPHLLCYQNGEMKWKTKINNSDSWTMPSDCED